MGDDEIDCNDNDDSLQDFSNGANATTDEFVCDGKDDNCNGQIDEGFYRDADGDGFVLYIADDAKDDCRAALLARDDINGLDEDCNEANDDIFPGAPDNQCDGIDSDCGDDADAFSLDANAVDEDGDGALISTIPACVTLLGGNIDCDDEDGQRAPSLNELDFGFDTFGDGKDNDCDDEIDEDFENKIRLPPPPRLPLPPLLLRHLLLNLLLLTIVQTLLSKFDLSMKVHLMLQMSSSKDNLFYQRKLNLPIMFSVI